MLTACMILLRYPLAERMTGIFVIVIATQGGPYDMPLILIPALQYRQFGGEEPFFSGAIIDDAQQLDVVFRLLDVAPGEHTLLRADDLFEGTFADLAEGLGIVAETGNVSADVAVEHAGYAHGFSGEDTGIDGLRNVLNC